MISAEDLLLTQTRRVKKNAFVIIRTDSNVQEQRTSVDKEGGSYPAWNEKVMMEFPMHARFVMVEVRCRTMSGGNRIIGSAKIPVTDFVGGFLPENHLHFLSYRLRDVGGGRNGIINLSLRVVNSSLNSPQNQGFDEISCLEKGFQVSGRVVDTDRVVMGIPVGRA